jgi:hypothetical protein
VAAVMLFLYRGMLDMKEEDHLILDDAESHLAREQAHIRQRVTALTRYIRVVGVAWSLLLVVLIGVWVAQGLNLI